MSAKENVEEVMRIGKQKGMGRRPILIKGIMEATRREMFTKTRLLKGTDIWMRRIYRKRYKKNRKYW